MIKNIFWLIIIFMTSYFCVLSNKVEDNRLYIKFHPDSELLKDWLSKGRSSEISAFSQILGEHIAYAFISDATFKMMDNKKQNARIHFHYALEDHLRNIAIVEYSSEIPPKIASKKLSSFPDIIYAEPIPVHEFSFVPNDPRLENQYYLPKIKIFSGWDHIDNADTVVVGIVDTGIDYDHPDLKENIFVNQGETGKDDQGNSKHNNGIDDDGNGYVDDWRGWDFVSSESTDGDNDPAPGHLHGTHVGGTVGGIVNNAIGIAGVCRNVKLLSVKVGSDNPMSVSVSNGFEGILYAALMGADVINCSWGSSSNSLAEEEVINSAVSFGSVIVAAAGNDGSETAQYPASYDGVMSVAAVDSSDRKAYFSNWHTSVDVSAPGVDIYATVPGEWYQFLDGTSMASPIAAGVAAMVKQKFIEYTALQCIEHVKAASDNIDDKNGFFAGKLGKGRVNAFNAMTIENPKSVIMTDYIIEDENNDNAYDAGELVTINPSFLNVLAPVENVNVTAYDVGMAGVEFIEKELFLGNMQTLEEKSEAGEISFRIPGDIEPDLDFTLRLKISDGDNYSSDEYIDMIFYPSYRTMDGNNITVTFNNRGNIAFNDYPSNFQGDGFKYKDSRNMLFEGALMIAVSPENVSNVARGSAQMAQNRSFFSDDIFKIESPGQIAAQEGRVGFTDVDQLEKNIGVEVKESVYQFGQPEKRDFIICIYDIENVSNQRIDSLFAGLYFDWDIGPSGRNNQAFFDNKYRYGFVENVTDPSLPVAAVQLLSFQKLNYFAIDNPGTTEENPGVWDGFTYQEKYRMLSSGLERTESSVTDVSQVIAGGPVNVDKGETVRISFAIFAADSSEQLSEISKRAAETAKFYDLSDGEINKVPSSDVLGDIYPNPVNDNTISFSIRVIGETDITIEIYDVSGRKLDQIITDEMFVPGYYDFSVNVENISQGNYFLKISTKNETFSRPFVIIR